MTLARIALILMLAVLAVPTAHAAEPTLDDKVRHLLLGLDDPKSSDQQFEQIKKSTTASFGNISPEAVARIVTLLKQEYDRVYADRFGVMVDVYKAVYTPEEIDLMYAFSITPAGAAILAKNATLRTELSAAMSDRMTELYRSFVKAVQADPELQTLLTKPPKDL